MWVILFIAAVVGGILGWYFWPKKKNDTPTKGDTIIISDEGSKLETYIELPILMHCRGDSGDPSFCNDINKETETNYVYDPNGSVSPNGSFTTSWNRETNLCSDGTTDCIYEENFDSNRKLLGITNAKGEDFIKKLIDDLWSGELDFDKETVKNGEKTTTKKVVSEMFDFNRNTGELFITENDSRIKVIPGNALSPDSKDGKMMTPVGIMILYIIFYYYGNNLPKPTIKLDLSSEKTLGELFLDMKSKLPPLSSAGSGTSED